MNKNSFLDTDIGAIRASKKLNKFIAYTKDDYEFNWHHSYLCGVLDDFVAGKIKKLMVFMPPQHGKSEIVSRRLPAFMLGKNPNLKIAGASYSHGLATKFNREIQRIMTSKEYSLVFPKTKLNEKRVVSDAKGSWLRNSEMFEVVGEQGSYLSVGVGGGLTGNRVDIMLLDDVVKDASQASSPSFQKRNIEWFDSVVDTRLHNDSQVLLCMTRWDVDDLAGVLLARESADWTVISFPAICENKANQDDPREIGEVMWESRHNLEKILRIKKNSNKIFNSLYQQNPRPPDDILVFSNAMKISAMPNIYEKIIGVDFGFSNSQTGICLVEIDRNNKRIYAKELYYNVGATNNTIANILAEYKLLCYCDSAEPKSVEELKVLGINALPAKKFPNSVLTQILYLQEFEIFYTGVNFDFERNHYQWQIGAGGYPINKEIDKYNHLFKALMYAVYTHLEGNTQVKPITTSQTKRYRVNNPQRH